MRRILPLLALPLFLAACDQNTTPTAEAPPAAEAPAEAPADLEPDEPQSPPAEPASGELDLEAITGSWAATTATCDTPIVISPTSFQGAENTCEIDSITDNGDGSLTAAMTCQAEGQTTEERVKMTPIFGPPGEGIRLEYLDRGGDPVTVFRCGG